MHDLTGHRRRRAETVFGQITLKEYCAARDVAAGEFRTVEMPLIGGVADIAGIMQQ